MGYLIDFWQPGKGHVRVRRRGSYESAKRYATEQLEVLDVCRAQIFDSGSMALLFSFIRYPNDDSPYSEAYQPRASTDQRLRSPAAVDD